MSFELIILEGPQAGRRLPIGSTPVTFGRSAGALLSFPQDNFLSGMHLSAQAAPEGLVINDLRSTNGSLLNGQRITSAVAVPGDLIKIGSLTLQVALAAPEAVPLAPPVRNAGPILSSPPASATLSTPVPPPVAAPADAPAKHAGVLDLLRATPGTLFCLLDAAADEMIPSLLALVSHQHPVQCLYDGNSAVNLARWAPYLLQLPTDSPLLGVLVEKGWGKSWASYFTSPASFDELRLHFRKFLMVQIEQGRQVYFRFYDPRVLRDFLPTANPAELAAFFGPVTEWMIEAADPLAVLRLRNSPIGLASQAVSVAAPVPMTQTIRLS